jgi:hypothetical protein
MRVSGIWSLFGAVIVALVIADLWANSAVTDTLIDAASTESKLIAGAPAASTAKK